MFTLPLDATDDDLRGAVTAWFGLVASGAIDEAEEFLDTRDSAESMKVQDFLSRISELTSGGMVTMPETFLPDVPPDELPVDGPVDIVCRWIRGSQTTEKHPGFVADIVHTIPVDGEWSDVDASFFVRANDGVLSLQLRDVVRCADN